MSDAPSFATETPLGRILLLGAAYAPMLGVLGLRVGFKPIGYALDGGAFLGCAVWMGWLLGISPNRQTGDFKLGAVEILDRDAAAYVATYLLPILAAKPTKTSVYLAYGLAALLILVVAYRADLGAVNPVAYAIGYRAYRVRCADRPRIVLSRTVLIEGEDWELADTAGLTVAIRQSSTTQNVRGSDQTIP